MKYSIRKVIRLLGEIGSLEGIASQENLLTALEEARVHLDDIAPFINSETNRIYRNRTLFIGGK